MIRKPCISNVAVEKIKGNNILIAKLMIAFDRSQNTIENWLAYKDIRLTTPLAIQIIKEESMLLENEILE